DSEIASVVSGYWSWVTTFSTYACGAPAYAYTISGEQTIGGYIGVSVGGGQSLEVWVDPGYYRINVYTQPVCNVLDVSEAVWNGEGDPEYPPDLGGGGSSPPP